MGLCFGKEDGDPTSNEVKANKEEWKSDDPSQQKVAAFVAEEKKPDRENAVGPIGVIPIVEEVPRVTTPIRTSSCTKEEVDAILIQCGRLSRSSSEKRKCSSSKRSFDFDDDRIREEGEDGGKAISRPSPRRKTPNRERSGSRERANQRRVSRSPVKRSDGPVKMVPVPAREKGVANASASRNSNGVGNRRNASPRSRSPANTNGRGLNENAQPQSLSRSSSRKAEQSPCRRNPMTEIDDNSTRVNYGSIAHKVQKSKEGDEGVRKGNQIQTQKLNDQLKSGGNSTTTISNCVRDQPMSCRAKEEQKPGAEVPEEAKDAKGVTEPESLSQRPPTTARSSRRSSKDLDNILGTNPTTYTSLLLEDIQNYHQKNAGLSLPACVSKACSILEAVADLNSSSSERSKRGSDPNEPFVESETVVKDDLMEPSPRRYISVRGLGGEREPQESAGSNSFVGQPWPASNSWERNSVDSTDRYWTSQSNDGGGVEESSGVGTRGSSSKSCGSATTPSGEKRDDDHRAQIHRGSGGGRAHSLPAASSSRRGKEMLA